MPDLKTVSFTVTIPVESIALGPDFLASFVRAQADSAINSALNSNEFWGLFQKGDET